MTWFRARPCLRGCQPWQNTPEETTMSTHTTNPRTRRPAGLTAATLLAAAAVIGPGAAAAHATAATITCTGTSPISYSPGLTFTPATSTYTEIDDFSSCLSSDPTLTSGSAYSTYTGTFSCLGLPEIVTDPGYVVTWNNRQSSTFTLTYTDTIAAGVENVTAVGTVTSGYLTGATAVFIWVYTLPNALACLTTEGATSQNGTLAATILATS
jgi:hypothetical protein